MVSICAVSRLPSASGCLEALLSTAPATVKYSEHFEAPGPAFLQNVQALGLEGMVSKRADLPYQPGRGSAWQKIKCARRQEMVIGGFTDPEGSREGFGALLLGVYEPDGRLSYSGKVGTGFTDGIARQRCTARSPDWCRRRARSTIRREARKRGALTGSSPCSSPRSRSPNGRTTERCAIRRFRACGRTSLRRTSFVSARREPDRKRNLERSACGDAGPCECSQDATTRTRSPAWR